MTQKEERIEIISKIKSGANIYRQYLLGNTFLYIFDNRYIEVSFRKQDFAHLTGVDTNLSAKDLYKESIKGTLTERQIFFSNRHPKVLCLKKVACLQDIHKCVLSKGFLLENITTQSASYKFGFTELNFTLCFGEDLDDDGNKKSNNFIIRSLRDEDCFQRSSNVYDVDFIFEKNNNCKKYSKLVYRNKNNKNLPSNILDKLNDDVIKSMGLKELVKN